VYLSASGIVKT